MNNNLEDSTVIIVILATLIIVFSLIFSMRPMQLNNQPSIEWRDSQNTTNRVVEL